MSSRSVLIPWSESICRCRCISSRNISVPAEWLTQIAEAAALATQTTHKLTLITGVHELLLNRPLQEAAQANLEYVGASVAAKTLAMTAMDFLQDEGLRKSAKAEFDQKMKEQPYVSPVPKGQKPILPED